MVLFLFILTQAFANQKIHDVSRLEHVQVAQVEHAREVEQIKALVAKAIAEKKKISIAGARHSQGGHIFYPDALVLDMTRFNRILRLDQKAKVLTVESGATWGDIQRAVNRYGLAVKVMQASNIFTVGGSLSVNAHGRDPRFGSLIDTIEGFRLLTADGQIKNVSRKENPELFQLAIGGYGLFGVVLDVDLSLTDNDVYRKTTHVIPTKDYPKYFLEKVKTDPEIGLHFAWPSIAPKTLLDEVLIADYRKTSERPKNVYDLQDEGLIPINKYVLDLSRRSNLGKSLRWGLQKRLIGYHGTVASRNNAMRPEVKFLDYDSKTDTDILQEYFFPIDRYEEFMTGLKKIIQDSNVNLLSITLRYVPADAEPLMRYAGDKDFFSAVLYINQGLSDRDVEKAEAWTRQMVDLALKVGGSYYLAYQRYPTREQFRRAYPNCEKFFNQKKKFDPGEVFFNKFYEFYK